MESAIWCPTGQLPDLGRRGLVLKPEGSCSLLLVAKASASSDSHLDGESLTQNFSFLDAIRAWDLFLLLNSPIGGLLSIDKQLAP